jgi:hypothetical protein
MVNMKIYIAINTTRKSVFFENIYKKKKYA